MPRKGFIDHIGIGVPDLGAAKRYYDDLMPILGLREWFPTRPGGPFNAETLDEPRDFPEYGLHYATYWVDPHGLKLEVVCCEGETAEEPS